MNFDWYGFSVFLRQVVCEDEFLLGVGDDKRGMSFAECRPKVRSKIGLVSDEECEFADKQIIKN